MAEQSQESWIVGSTYASSTKGYNAYGLIASSTDPRGATTTYAYDAFNLYVATTTNALGHQVGALYEYAKGAVKRTIDANGLVRTTTLDPVGRLTEEKQPDLTTPSTLVTNKTYAYTDTFPNRVHVWTAPCGQARSGVATIAVGGAVMCLACWCSHSHGCWP